MKRLAAILVVAALALCCSLERIHYHSGRYDHWIQTPGVITHVRPYVIFRTSSQVQSSVISTMIFWSAA